MSNLLTLTMFSYFLVFFDFLPPYAGDIIIYAGIGFLIMGIFLSMIFLFIKLAVPALVKLIKYTMKEMATVFDDMDKQS